MNNNIYTKPEIEIVLFEEEDIMTASVVYGDQSLFDDEKTDFWF